MDDNEPRIWVPAETLNWLLQAGEPVFGVHVPSPTEQGTLPKSVLSSIATKLFDLSYALGKNIEDKERLIREQQGRVQESEKRLRRAQDEVKYAERVHKENVDQLSFMNRSVENLKSFKDTIDKHLTKIQDSLYYGFCVGPGTKPDEEE
jgi:hypothetical protein